MEMQSFSADLLCTFALRPGARERLDEMIASGEISPKNIVSLLAPRALKDRKILSQIISWVGERARENGVKIAAPSQESAVATKEDVVTETQPQKSTRSYDKTEQTRWNELEITKENAKGAENRSYLQRLAQHTLLNREEESSLFQRVGEGDLGARNKLVRQNQRLVIQIARRFLWSGLELEDLIQEGTLGLIKAIEDFDPGRGHKLSTYATWWIRQSISRAIMDTGSLIRVPVHLQEKYGKILRTHARLKTALKREPTNAEIAAKLGMSVDQVTEILSRGSFEYTHIDEPVTDEDDSGSSHEMIPEAGSTEYAIILIEAQELQTEIEKKLKAVLWYLQTTTKLPPRTVAMFRDRYGLKDGQFKQRTLQMIGASFDLTRERVRQIMESAWKVLTPKFLLTEEELLESISQLQELEKITGIESKLGP